MDFRMLGPIEVRTGAGPVDIGQPRQRAVLAALLADVTRPVGVDALVDRVWGEAPPPRVRHTLQAYVSALRRALAGGAELRRTGGGYLLDVPPERVDVNRFDALVAGVAPEASAADRAAALRRALGLWRGVPLADVPGDWAQRFRERWDARRIEVALAWAEAAAAAGEAAATVVPLVELSEQYPLVEPLAAALVRALAANGRAGEALARYAVTRDRLVAELGTEPGEELRQLHGRLLRLTADSGPTGPGPAQLPLDVAAFTGRGAELAALDARPVAGVVVLSGLAGVGKTTLAVHWAHRSRSRYADGQLYVDLRGFDRDTAVDPADAVRGLLDGLGVEPHRVPPGRDARAALFRSLSADRRLLVLLDNARDADQVRPLLAAGPGVRTVVTSRDRLTALVAETGADALELDLPDRREAVELLRRGTRGGDRAAAAEVVLACGRLPLALALVAARVRQTGFPLAAVAAELRQPGPAVLAGVRAAFSWSYGALDPADARLFRLLGLPAGPDVAADAVAALADRPPAAAVRALRRLTEASLLTEPTPGRYRLHDLLRGYARQLAHDTDPEPDRRAALTRLLDHYTAVAYGSGSTPASSAKDCKWGNCYRPKPKPCTTKCTKLQTGVAAPAAGYTFEWYIGEKDDIGDEYTVMRQFQDDPNAVFPFDVNVCAKISYLATCALDVNPAFDHAGVQVTEVSETSFTFTVTGEHFDQPGSTISFRTYTRDGHVYLAQTGVWVAHNPAEAAAARLTQPLAKQTWQQQAGNLKTQSGAYAYARTGDPLYADDFYSYQLYGGTINPDLV